MPEQLEKLQILIDGEWREPATGEFLESLDPCTAEPWALVPRCGKQDADAAVAAAQKAFQSGPWSEMTATARGALLRRLGDLIARDSAELSKTETRDNGKLISETSAQAAYVPQWFYYYGGLADKIEGSTLPTDKPKMFNFTRYEPIGPVLAITAWNSPLLLAAYKLAPALAAGNTVVLKPSEHASVSTLKLARLFEEAGFPPGVVNVVTGYGPEVGAALTEDPRIAKIAFTGSEATGRAISRVASADLKTVVLELGGKSPNIVFEDANLDNAVNGVISGIFAASGQTCVAGSRLLLQDTIYDDFMEKLLKVAKTARVGDPSLAETQVGPVTSRDQYNKILKYLEIAKSEGAHCLLGGGPARIDGLENGWFVEPTIFTGVDNTMRIAREEVFGPVLSVLKFKTQEEAIEIANDTDFGLAAGVWTTNLNRGITMSERLQAGTVWVNTYRAVSYMTPFGGYKNSGVGRENGAEALKQYLQTKSVWISLEETVANPFIIR